LSAIDLALLSFVFLPAVWRTERAYGTDPANLPKLVADYLGDDREEERAKLLAEIEGSSGGSIELVASTVREALLGPRLLSGDSFPISTASADVVTLHWRGPDVPDRTPPHPLILCLPDDDELGDPGVALSRMRLLGPAVDENDFRAVVNRRLGSRFQQPPETAADWRSIIRALRRNLPVDSDRIYLYGRGAGGEAAWMAATLNPDLFAGVVAVASVPRLPYSRQLLPLLIPNLSAMRVLSIRSGADSAALLDARLEAIVANGSRLGIAIRGAIAEDPSNEKTELAWLRGAVRPRPGRPVSHWFRYPAQGDAGWIRAAKLYGDVWTEDQLSIAPAPQRDRDEFITDVLKGQLFHFSGDMDGQTLTITTHRIAEIEIRFYEGMTDFNKPVTVLLNGRKRHDALLRPSLATLLESARRDRDPQRLVLAVLTFTIAPETP